METGNQSDKMHSVTTVEQNKTLDSQGFEPISFYKKDKNFVFAHQKTAKLVAAIYILTNFFPAEEPLKWSIRKLGAKLLSLAIPLSKDSSFQQADSELVIRDTILELSSLLEVASFSGLVSEMNLNILKKEFHALLGHIHKTLSRREERNALELEEELNIPQIEQTTEYSRISAHSMRVDRNTDSRFEKDTEEDDELVKDKIEKTDKQAKQMKEFSPVAVKKNKRQSAIIHLLKRKKEIMVKDVVAVIQDCSEKTLQRELLALVSAGILTKEGERRWTRYSLATAV